MLNTCVFVISLLGWYQYFKSKCIPRSHIPLLICCIHTLTLYIAAFLGLLTVCSVILAVIGFVLLLYTGFRRKLSFALPTIGLTVFFLGLIWALISSMDALSYTWSDMSHWMRYVKALLSDGCYPTAAHHPEISYSSYPPGTSLFISYLVPFLPMHYLSGKAIFALKVLQLACISAIVSPLEQLPCSRPVKLGCACVIGVMLFGLIPYTFTIMTDLLLGLITAAMISICLYCTKDRFNCVKILLPICSCLCIIKNSAPLFLLFMLFFFLYSEKKHTKRKYALLLQGIAIIVIPMALFVSWVLFSRVAYPALDASMQALSIQRFKSILTAHEVGFYKQLILLYVGRFFSADGRELVAFWALIAVFLVLFFVFYSKIPRGEAHEISKIAVLMFLCDGLYVLFLLASYMFSFTEKEALELASFPRYFGSMAAIHITVVGYLCIRILAHLPARIKKNGLRILLIAGALFIYLNQMYTFAWQSLETNETFRNPIEPDDWYVRKLNSAVENRLSMDEEEQYILWLIDRTGEPKINEDYNVTMYCRIALSSYFCVPSDNVRVLDITRNNPKDVKFVLNSFMERENAVVVVTDMRSESLTAAESLNIPIYMPKS